MLHASPPGVSEESRTILEKQQDIMTVVKNKGIASVLQGLTQIGGADRLKNQLKSVLTDGESCNPFVSSISGGR